MEIAVVGPGRLGSQLASGILRAGGRVRVVRGLRGGDPTNPELPSGVPYDTWDEPAVPLSGCLVVLAVPDKAIEHAAEAIVREGLQRPTTVLHASGLHTSALLRPCHAAGASIASWHPLAAFPPLAVEEVSWKGIWTAIEGDTDGSARARELSVALGCTPWNIDPANKPLYHAAASVAANLTHILAAQAVRLMESCGVGDPERALEPLVLDSVRAALRHPDLEALTGPLVRGDRSTVRRHLEVLPPPLAEVYRVLSSLAEVEPQAPDSSGTTPSRKQRRAR